jgi:cytochrome b561
MLCLQHEKKTPDAREREMQRVGAKIMHTYLYLLTASFFSSLIIIMHSEPALCLCLCAGAAYNVRASVHICGEERKRILSIYASCAHGTFSHIIIIW